MSNRPMGRDDVVGLADAIGDDFGRCIDFILEIDKLKGVIRRSRIADGSRLENTAEHSWHLAMVATVMAGWAGPEVDLARAISMLLVHDIVEVDAGDTFAYDTAGNEDKRIRELAAAERIFGIPPEPIGAAMRSLWDEYEERRTPTARFAYACDRLQPILLNATTGGISWREHGIRQSQVRAFNEPISDASSEIWTFVQSLIDAATAAGALGPG
jgi:putative hydrolase of HD superfamily